MPNIQSKEDTYIHTSHSKCQIFRAKKIHTSHSKCQIFRAKKIHTYILVIVNAKYPEQRRYIHTY